MNNIGLPSLGGTLLKISANHDVLIREHDKVGKVGNDVVVSAAGGLKFKRRLCGRYEYRIAKCYQRSRKSFLEPASAPPTSKLSHDGYRRRRSALCRHRKFAKDNNIKYSTGQAD
ncbi:unnamed protein product [Macrosiphum euphorbiae]|nr:unnamed protein product [Macrosiphum euphorbiae]